ncbi:hypothetical protein DPMN_089621 [Dreissena polymorpha]|uniref:Uncharacterized protein n=1 Tax=Dreissena polymorpha TaxID=45954 RepID=A0A9D4KYN3_DREPO|nr:hypothetical protein DPMN_089621 [Dreissena polymorpha]
MDSSFFYVPAFSSKRKQHEVSCIDSSHLLTRTRRKCCKGGLDGLLNDAWNIVAKTGHTNLSIAMTDCVIDPMSVPLAATHFSEEVEKAMIEEGYIDEANLCRDVRLLWKAEGAPGIPARERIGMRLGLRRRLLRHVTFGHFPPPGIFIGGLPSQLWEGLISSIDAKTLLYSLANGNTYNTRAFSSLCGETIFL